MNLLIKISTALLSLCSFAACNAKIKNTKTVAVKIYGNCELCKKTIEKAGNVKNIAEVVWNKDSKTATFTYDSLKTNADEILKRIALAGYDNEKYFAPDDVYAKLPDCCKYDRNKKSQPAQMPIVEDHSGHIKDSVAKQEENQLDAIFENYFSLKNALVKSDAKLAASVAKEMLSKLSAIEMEILTTNEHKVWMKVLNNLKTNIGKISSTTSVEDQRILFMTVSANIYELMKVSNPAITVYYQYCPMYNNGNGANWLSKENTIKNPYYGSQMLSCGKTLEIIK